LISVAVIPSEEESGFPGLWFSERDEQFTCRLITYRTTLVSGFYQCIYS
jgi:hypothetical protein